MKKRPGSHVTGDAGAQLLRSVLPQEWVVRPYQPDYGIDFAVEVFDRRGDGFVTLGEHFFVQLKSHANVRPTTKDVYPRQNVEKTAPKADHSESRSMEVIAEPLERNELELARSMGPAAPLLLVVADTTRSELYWVCLNDFVDKVLLPESPSRQLDQDSYTVHLPTFNRIDKTGAALIPLKFFARRAKLYAAFNRFRYQNHEIRYALDHGTDVDSREPDTSTLRLAKHFLETALALDFWGTTDAWPAVAITHAFAQATSLKIAKALRREPLDSIISASLSGVTFTDESRSDLQKFLFLSEIESTFSRLANLGNMFEEICREWYLPTFFSELAWEHAIR